VSLFNYGGAVITVFRFRNHKILVLLRYSRIILSVIGAIYPAYRAAKWSRLTLCVLLYSTDSYLYFRRNIMGIAEIFNGLERRKYVRVCEPLPGNSGSFSRATGISFRRRMEKLHRAECGHRRRQDQVKPADNELKQAVSKGIDTFELEITFPLKEQ